MNFEDSIAIDAPVHDLWDFLLDVDRSAACVPGVDEVRLVDDQTFDGVIAARVGPIEGKFSFRAHIIDSTPPTELTAIVTGTDSVTKSQLDVQMGMNLVADSPSSTTLRYRATVDVRGRLAILGDMVLRATASLILDEFTKRLKRQMADAARQA
ncbi:MAG TPA: SRPBCC domain-containing protein [Chloroflexota bacterium]|nr:SRPBCC domain-containing protein [Chloroflexota bacterium]